jgi:CspA family cold shock protein
MQSINSRQDAAEISGACQTNWSFLMEICQSNVRGVVKLFRPNKGYGFIVDSSGQDYFVHVSDIQDDDTLTRGDRVAFNSTLGDRGWRAVSVRVKQKQASDVPSSRQGSADDSEQTTSSSAPTNPIDENGLVCCPSCQTRVRPRIITSSRAMWNDPSSHHQRRLGVVPMYSACPACGDTIEKFNRTDNEIMIEKADELAPMVGLLVGVLALFGFAGYVFHQLFG